MWRAGLEALGARAARPYQARPSPALPRAWWGLRAGLLVFRGPSPTLRPGLGGGRNQARSVADEELYSSYDHSDLLSVAVGELELGFHHHSGSLGDH